MGWLLAKDLRILGRSRLLVAVLVVYPVAIALLIGLAISRSPAKPKIAIVDEAPAGETVRVGSQRVEVGSYAEGLLEQVQPMRVAGRSQALSAVKSGRALAAVVIPPDIAARISSGLQGRLEVLYDGNALEQSLVQSELNAAIAQANLSFSEQIQAAISEGIDTLLKGGNAAALGGPANLIGLRQIPGDLSVLIARTGPGAARASLVRMRDFAGFAAQNLRLASTVLASVGQPIRVDSRLVAGRRTPLNDFAVVVAVAVSLMFVCVLLASGSMALEREEHVLARLGRGLVSRWALLGEKVALAGACSLVLALAMLAGIGALVSLQWSRAGLWVAALAFAAVAFAALGVAIGALAREVRAASLVAFAASLPLAFLALVPRGSVASGLYDVIGVISFLFPFKAALQALDCAVNAASPPLWESLAHLAGLAVAFAALARIGLRRLD